MRALLLSFLAGLIGALGFEPVGLWPLTPLAMTGLLWLLAEAPSLRAARTDPLRGIRFGA